MSENQKYSKNNSHYSKYHANTSNYNPVSANKGVKAHWIAYLAVNGFLLLLNFLIGFSYGYWSLYPILSWGIGISIHTSVIYIINRYPYKSDRGFYIHFAVILILSIYLLLLNLITSDYYLWFAWPVAAMGVGVGEHFVAYKRIKRIETGQRVPRLHALWYPAVPCFFLVFVDIFSNGYPNWFWWPVVPIMFVSFVIIDSVTRHRENLRFRYHERQAKIRANTNINTNTNANANTAFSQEERREVVVERRDNNTQSDRRYCPRCGEQNTPGHAFCEYCGLKFE